MNATWMVYVAAVALLIPVQPAAAATQRTFVASTGVDANPCTITQPCRSFGTAIAHTLVGGEVIVLDSAGYGVVTIAKSVSINAPAGIYAGISPTGGQVGVTVDGSGITVALRGLTINGIGGTAGIEFVQGSRLRIENCVIANVSGAGIAQQASGSEMAIVDTIVRDNGGAGIVLFTDASMLLDGVRVVHNGADGIYAVAVASLASVTIRNSVLSNNGGHGIAAVMPPSPAVSKVVIENSALSRNAAGGFLAGGTSGDGRVSAILRRNVIAGNGLAGISALNGPAGGQANVQTADNSFSGNGTYAIASAGYPSQVYSSANVFDWLDNAFWTGPGGYQATYGDNSGSSTSTGPAPAAFTKF